jgi:MYXO-CTERM domain-containing protein
MLGSALVLAAACSGTGEESQSEPVSSAINALESGIDGGASKVLLNEIKVNPNGGTDQPNEWVELRGTPGGLLTNVYFVALEGEFEAVDSGSGPSGEVDYIANLGTACGGNPCALGSNGLLLLGAANVHTPAVPGTTHVTDATFAADQVFENGSASFALIYSEIPLQPLSADGAPVAFDLDPNDDGTLDLLPGAFVIDSIGYAEVSADLVYGTELTIGVDGPAAATRLSSNTTENSAAAWFYGALAAGTGSNVYAPASGIPIDARLTPGAPNVFATPDAGGDAGGGTGGSAGDASVGTGGTGTDAGRDGSAGTGAGGSAGSAGSAGAAGSPGTGGSAGAATAGTGGRAGSAGTAGRDGGRAGSAGKKGGGDDDDDGCSCSTPTASHTPTGLFAMLAALSLLGWRRKRR